VSDISDFQERICFMRVVLPAPKNPARSTTLAFLCSVKTSRSFIGCACPHSVAPAPGRIEKYILRPLVYHQRLTRPSCLHRPQSTSKPKALSRPYWFIEIDIFSYAQIGLPLKKWKTRKDKTLFFFYVQRNFRITS